MYICFACKLTYIHIHTYTYIHTYIHIQTYILNSTNQYKNSKYIKLISIHTYNIHFFVVQEGAALPSYIVHTYVLNRVQLEI